MLMVLLFTFQHCLSQQETRSTHDVWQDGTANAVHLSQVRRHIEYNADENEAVRGIDLVFTVA